MGSEGRSVYLVRVPSRQLFAAVNDGRSVESIQFGIAAALADRLHEEGFALNEVRVAGDTFRVWLERAGVSVKGDVVGWLVQPAG